MAPSLTLVLLSLLFCVRAREQPTTVETLSTDCSLKLNELWALYTTPASYPEGCDGACLMACKETLEDAIYSETAVECPAQTEIVRCFGVRRAHASLRASLQKPSPSIRCCPVQHARGLTCGFPLCAGVPRSVE